jgi:hypothetical protein
MNTNENKIPLSEKKEFKNYIMNMAGTMLHFYDYQDAVELEGDEHQIRLEAKNIGGITFRIEFDRHYLRGHGKLFYAHSVIISLVTTLESYLEDKFYALLKKFDLNNILDDFIKEYISVKSFQRVNEVKKIYQKLFDIDIFKDINRKTIDDLLKRRHTIIHRGGLIDDKKTINKCDFPDDMIGIYFSLKEDKLVKYIDTVNMMVSSIERQSDKYYQNNK